MLRNSSDILLNLNTKKIFYKNIFNRKAFFRLAISVHLNVRLFKNNL
jgi:hypothetical protein